MSLFGRALSPARDLATRVASPISFFRTTPGPEPPPAVAPPTYAQVVASQPPPPPLPPVSFPEVVASASASKAPSRVRKTPVSAFPAPTAEVPPPRRSGRAVKGSLPIPTPQITLAPTPVATSKQTNKGKRNISADKKQEKILKERFLKEQGEEAEAKRFLQEQLPQEVQKLESEIQTKGESEMLAPVPLSRKLENRMNRMKMKELVKKIIADQRTQAMIQERIKLREQKIILEQEEIEKQNITSKQKKRREESVTDITKRIQDRAKDLKDVESIPVFTGYSDADIQKFVEKQFPRDALSILDNFATLTPEAQNEIVEFIVLKCKAVTLNTIIDVPGAIDDRYNELGIKSLPLVAASGAVLFPGMPSSARALMVCEVAPCVVPADWCCCIGSDGNFSHIADILKAQNLPFVTAHPDIQRMIAECSRPPGVAPSASAFAAAAPGAGGQDPDGFDDPFPSVIIGDEMVVYSIGPIIDDEALFGRPLIMIRIHNYKTQDYPNGIYFWTYPSFSEGGTARVFLTIGGKKFMKGPDYTLTTFILDLLQVHINTYYVKHFVNKQGNGNYHPTTLSNQQEIVCFFGGMIHLQTQWVHDLIAGRGINLGQAPLQPVRGRFNRHCYRFNTALPMNLWVMRGISDVEIFKYTNEAALLASEFRKDNNLYSCNIMQGQRVSSSFPLSCCLTTLFHKYRDKGGHKSDVNDFFELFKKWPETLFVQGCSVVCGVSPVACIVAGSASNISGMKNNSYLERLSTPAIATKLASLRLLQPISTIDTGASFSALPMMSRRGVIMIKKALFPGSNVVGSVSEANLIELDTPKIARKIQIEAQRTGAQLTRDQRVGIIFNNLPRALKTSIENICDIFFGNPPLLPPNELVKLKRCFTLFLHFMTNIQTCDQLKYHIIENSFNYIPDDSDILIIRDSPLYRLVRTLESGVYRHLLMSSILSEYTDVASFPLDIPIPQDLDPQLNPRVTCSFLNRDGQYVELPGGPRGPGGLGARAIGNCDFSDIFQDPLFDPYIFSATRKSMTFPPGILDRYIKNPSGVTPHTAHADATIPVKVHNKMFLLRLIFSTSEGGIQVVVCVSSTICIANPGGGQAPYIPFGVDVQFNVVSIGPLGLVSEGRAGLSAFATILATMSDYLSLGCMGAAKKGEYSKTAGYQQFLDYLDDYFRTIMTECFTYVSAYISPFNSGRDIVMKHFGGVFENFGDNPNCDAIRGMWDWFRYLPDGHGGLLLEGYLPHVQRQVCSINDGVDRLLTPAMLEEAITSGRRNMQVVVVALFDPILGQLDEREFGELTDDVKSHVGSDDDGSMSRSGSSDSRSSAASSVDSGAVLARQVVHGDTLGSQDTSDTWQGSMDSSGSQNSSSSVEPFVPGPGFPIGLGDSDGGSTRRRTNKNKKTRKYIGNRKNKTKSKRKMNAIRRIINGNMRTRAHTRKNTHASRTKPKTMKVKNKKFPKRIYLYSTPRIAQRMAYKYLGRIKTAKLYPARNPAKKYMVYDPKNNKWVNFGQMGYEDYTKHHDKTRRKNYLTRTKGMLGDWKSNKYSANNLSRRILWT